MKRSCLIDELKKIEKLNWKNFGIYGGGWTKKEISCLGKWLPFWEGEGDCRGRVANPHGFGVPKREKWGKKCFSNGQNERRSFTSVLSSPCQALCLKRDLALLTTEDLGDCCGSDFSVFVGVCFCVLCFVFASSIIFNKNQKSRQEEKRREDVDVRCKKT